MKISEYQQGFVIGLVLGAIMIITMCSYFIIRPMLALENTRMQLIEECQKVLPRNQTCELVAVPEEKP
jgi:hypothetical protein